MRYMVGGEGTSGPHYEGKKTKPQKAESRPLPALVKANKAHVKVKKPMSPPAAQATANSQSFTQGVSRKKKSETVRLGNFEKMITFTLKKKPEAILQDGEFSKIVKKGTQEIIQALHKTDSTATMSMRLEQFLRCEKLLKELSNKFIIPLSQTTKSSLAKRKEILAVTKVIEEALMAFKRFKNEKDSFRNDVIAVEVACVPNAVADLQDLPNDLIGTIASFLPEDEVDKALDPLIDQLAKKSERAVVKAAARKEAVKGEKFTKEVEDKIRQALKTQGSTFVFPEELRNKIQFVSRLDLSDLGVPLHAEAMRELLSNCPDLTELNLATNKVTKEVLSLVCDLKDLRHLDLHATQLDDSVFELVAKCKHLETLNCNLCLQITTLKPLAACPRLKTLNCSLCPRITTLEPLAACENLETLNCAGCSQLTTLKALASCENLQDLDCGECSQLTTLEPLVSCKNLQSLDCRNCSQLTTLQPLASCSKLQSLNCNDCYEITTLEPLESCTNLQSLSCNDCSALTTLNPLAACTKLQQLYCSRCSNITTLGRLVSCTNLRRLTCLDCLGITRQEKDVLKQAMPKLEIIDEFN